MLQTNVCRHMLHIKVFSSSFENHKIFHGVAQTIKRNQWWWQKLCRYKFHLLCDVILLNPHTPTRNISNPQKLKMDLKMMVFLLRRIKYQRMEIKICKSLDLVQRTAGFFYAKHIFRISILNVNRRKAASFSLWQLLDSWQ